MNSEDFVTYEQAITLKKLGFDLYCDYTSEEKTYPKYILSFDPLGREGYIEAPTLDEVQRWLIDKKGLVVCPGPEAEYVPNSEKKNDNRYVHTGWTYNILVITEEGDLRPGPWHPEGVVYSSYNEALSEGINNCFKLLEGKEELSQYGILPGTDKFHTAPFKQEPARIK